MSYPEFVNDLKDLNLKKKGKHPKVSPAKFYPSQAELQTTELVSEELNDYADKMMRAAQTGHVKAVYDTLGAVPDVYKEKAARISRDVYKFNTLAFADFSKLVVGERYFPSSDNKALILNSWTENFVNLCKSTNEEMRKKVAGVVSDGVLLGRNLRETVLEVQNTCSTFSRSKAELIATTEIGKLNSAIARTQSEAAGIKYYEWSAAMDGRTRESHAVMDGKICKWGDDDYYYKWEDQPDGKRNLVRTPRPGNAYKGAPGTDFRCRCVALPYVPEYEDDYTREDGPVQGVTQEHPEEAPPQEELLAMRRKVEILQIAHKRHEMRTKEQEKAIRDELARRMKIRDDLRKAIAEVKGIPDVDVKNAEGALQLGGPSGYKQMEKETTKLKDVVSDINGLSLLANPMEAARQFGAEEARKVNDAVSKKLKGMSNDLSDRKKSLEFEIQWVEDHKKYKTWKVAQDAYKKELASVEEQIKWEAQDERAKNIEDLFTGSSSKTVAAALEKIKKARTAGNMKAMEKAMDDAEALYNKLNAKRLSKLAVAKGDRIHGTPPKTLKYIDECVQDYKDDDSHFDKNLFAHEADIKKAMLDFFDKTDFGMDIKASLLESVFDKGFLNTFQTGTSNGYNGSHKTTGPIETGHSRLGASHYFFQSKSSGMKGTGHNYTGTQLKRKEYEKYGHVIDKDKVESFNVLTGYGNCQVRFKKQKVNCTWTWDDSLCERYQPSLTTDPSSVSMDHDFRDLSKRPKSTDIFTTVNKFQSVHGHTSYVELQYHGDVTIDDVESITFKSKPKDVASTGWDTWITKDLADKFVQRGVEIWYIENGKAVQYIPKLGKKKP